MNNFTLVNCDTDSISFCKPDGDPFTEQEQVSLLQELNSLYPSKIRFEHDGIFETVCVLKAKNYILKGYLCKKCKKAGTKECPHEEAKLTKKGSSLKSSKIEPALKKFMDEIINAILTNKQDTILSIYHRYVINVHNITDMTPWCSKKTITESVLNPGRTNEEKVLDALKGQPVQMGDKIYVYYAEERTTIKVPRFKKDRITKEKVQVGEVEKEVVATPLRLREDWSELKDHSIDSLLKRLYNTIEIFENVIDISKFLKYYQSGKKEALKKLLEEA